MNFELVTGAAIPEDLLAESRSHATAVGYANGWSQGLRQVHAMHAGETERAERRIAEVAARHAEALLSATFALHEAAYQLEQRSVASLDELSTVVLSAAVEIAEALLGRELRDRETAADAALLRVLNMTPQDAPVTVRLSPSDHHALTVANDFSQHSQSARQIVLEVDPSLEPGDAIGVSGATTVDARLGEAVKRLREHLQS